MVEKGSIIVDVILRRRGPSGWPNVIGIRGRMSSESVAECHRNPWPNVIGIRGRMSSESVAECGRNMHMVKSKRVGK
jgi:hypothetical protein